MKKLLLFVFFISFPVVNNAQNISYGIVFGANYHDNEDKVSNSLVTSKVQEKANFQIGGFVDYRFLKKFGLKLNVLFNKSNESYSFMIPGFNSTSSTFNLNYLQIIPHLKYNIKKENNQSGYLLFGPRLNILLKAEDNFGDNAEDFYKETNFGVQLGFGFNLLNHFAIELLGEYGFSDISESDIIKITTAGVYLNLNMKLDSLFN